eukprot:178947-Pyramimonas_sp.AAC.1
MPPKSSKFRGVTLFRPTGKWRAQISAAGLISAARAEYTSQSTPGPAKHTRSFPVLAYSIRNKRALMSSGKCTWHLGHLDVSARWHGMHTWNALARRTVRSDHDTEEEAARAFDRAAINK